MRRPLVLLIGALCACALPSTTRAPDNSESASGRLDPAAHLRAGRAALQQKKGALAVAHLRACVEQEPSNVDCLWELGWAHYLQNDWESVIAAWQQLKALKPDHPEVDGRLEDARNQQQLRRRLHETAREAPPAVRAPLPPGVSLRIRAAGDVMLGTDFPAGFLPPDDGARMLAGVEDWLRDADLTFVNLEGPLCDDPRPSDKCRRGGNCYAFRMPTRYARYLVDAGVDLASTANNHSGDFGEACRRQTEAALDRAGIRWSGPPGSIASMEAKRLRVALVAFHTSAATNYVNDTGTTE